MVFVVRLVFEQFQKVFLAQLQHRTEVQTRNANVVHNFLEELHFSNQNMVVGDLENSVGQLVEKLDSSLHEENQVLLVARLVLPLLYDGVVLAQELLPEANADFVDELVFENPEENDVFGETLVLLENEVPFEAVGEEVEYVFLQLVGIDEHPVFLEDELEVLTDALFELFGQLFLAHEGVHSLYLVLVVLGVAV